VPRRFGNAASYVLVDDRFLPLLVTRWVGESELGVSRQQKDYGEQLLLEARRVGGVILEIQDGRGAGRPDAKTRKVFAEWMLERKQNFPEAVLPSHVVVDNPVHRGVATALAWLTGAASDMLFYPTLEAALRGALAHLERLGRVLPTGLDPATYEYPDAPA
jgi:hypothetical protein